MKLIAIWFVMLAEAIASCAFAQHKSLLLINSAKADTVVFETGGHVVIRTNFLDTAYESRNSAWAGADEIKGRLNEINDSSLKVGKTYIPFSSIHYLREKNAAGMVIVKTIGATATVLGMLITYVIAGLPPTPSDNPYHQDEYEQEMRDYHKSIAISASITTVVGVSTLLIHNKKYYFNKGWHPYVYSPAAVEVQKTDSTKTPAGEPLVKAQLKDSVLLYPYNQKISNHAAYLQFSTEITYSMFYDHLWKINNIFNLSSSAGVGKEKYSDNVIIPISLGCVIGKKQHRIEIGQMSWLPINDQNPSLLGVLAYRFQSYNGQVFFRGGMLITELSHYPPEHRINPFGSIGIGF
jgi:hypothetical protein